MNNEFLPVTPAEMKKAGIERPDFVYITGDAYVDHPSFGHAIISRILQANGFSVCIIPQPDWKDVAGIAIFGEPRLGFLVTAGNMDSMVNHYTVARRHRNTDAYSPGGKAGMRPDRAAMVYCNLIRSKYKKTPIIVGGIEASLRRMAHYDYWSDSLRRSLLMECGADLISYGMGEKSIVEIAQALDAGICISDITFVRGTCYRTRKEELLGDAILLPSYEELLQDKLNYARSFLIQYQNTDPVSGRSMAERYGNTYVVQNPPAMPLTTQEMDDVYALPYTRRWHPMYDEAGGVPALQEVLFSLTSCRGCFGGCNFCALTFHQGRIIQSRSHESLLAEAKLMTEDPRFKGYIHDVGGPTANFRAPACDAQLKRGVCKNRQCLTPKPCPNLKADHQDYIALLRKLRALPGVKKVFVRSGIRFDYLLCDASDAFLEELVRYHISGQLKVAPEHVSSRVLKMMGKPEHSVYERFTDAYYKMNRRFDLKQYLVPYLMSSHPGCSMNEAVELALFLKELGYMPEQVQDFYPTPSTISTCMYYTGVDPRTMHKVYVPRDPHEKAMQRSLIQYRDPKNRALVEEALKAAGREDLIGFGKACLIRPDERHHAKNKRAAGARAAGARAARVRHENNKPAAGKSQINRDSHKSPSRVTNKKGHH